MAERVRVRLEIVSMDKILRFTNTLIFIIYYLLLLLLLLRLVLMLLLHLLFVVHFRTLVKTGRIIAVIVSTADYSQCPSLLSHLHSDFREYLDFLLLCLLSKLFFFFLLLLLLLLL